MQHVDPYLSASDLKIKDWERYRLIQVMGLLERKEIEFDMNQWPSANVCGTACCIGGNIELLEFKSFGNYNFTRPGVICPSKDLMPLFYPWFVCLYEEAINPTHEQGARAIHNFLMGKVKDCWELALYQS